MLQPAPPPPPHVITNPDWVQRPDGPALGAAYPEAAIRLGLSGRAVIRCRVTEAGVLSDCALRQESPAGLGFAQAALRLSRTFRMKPRTRDGQPIGDGVVTIPLNFVAPGSGTPAFAEPATMVREAREGQAMPSDRTAPCPDGSGKLCISEPFRWVVSPVLDPARPLYGAVEVRCRIVEGGALADCRGAALTRAADVEAAVGAAAGLRAPGVVASVPTTGASTRFVIIPPPAPTRTTTLGPQAGAPWADYDRGHVNLVALIAHGSDADLQAIALAAAQAGFPGKHTEGPKGDELLVPFAGRAQAAAKAFVRETRGGRYPAVRFEEATLPAGDGEPMVR